MKNCLHIPLYVLDSSLQINIKNVAIFILSTSFLFCVFVILIAQPYPLGKKQLTGTAN